MLYVVAWPLLSEADDTALRRLRAQYHPREAGLIGPHFTLVFGAPAEQETRLRAAFQAMVAHRPFWFVIDRIVAHPQIVVAQGAAHVFKFSSLVGKITAQLSVSGDTEYPIDAFTGLLIGHSVAVDEHAGPTEDNIPIFV